MLDVKALKKRIIIGLAILVILIVSIFLLWYTRPLSFAELQGEREVHDIILSCTIRNDSSARYEFTRYNLTLYPGDELADEVMSLLASTRYKSCLINLTKPDRLEPNDRKPSSYYTDTDILGIAEIHIDFTDKDTINLNVSGEYAILSDNGLSLYRLTNKTLLDSFAHIIIENGEAKVQD